MALVKEGVDEGTGAPVLPGVGFELYNASVNEDGSWTKTGLVTDGAKTTDQGGNVVFDDLIDGNYLLYETKAADRYLCSIRKRQFYRRNLFSIGIIISDTISIRYMFLTYIILVFRH